MKFHIDHTPKKAGFELSHSNGIFLLGSCFSEEIGKRMIEMRMKVYKNPNGILFNPLSMEMCLNAILSGSVDTKKILERGTEYFSYDHHSSVKANSKKELVDQIKEEQKKALHFLQDAKVLIFTFGTAFYYRELELNAVVANCHKQKSTLFAKEHCTYESIVSKYGALLTSIKKINPSIQFIFTVSPVKYLKDGVEKNSLSKSILILAAQTICQQNKDSHYFPAYELVSDDLRDHRFYKEDLAHPNEQAINYVWEKFSHTFFSEKTQNLNQKISQLNRALSHKPLHSNKEEEGKFEKFVLDLEQEVKKTMLP